MAEITKPIVLDETVKELVQIFKNVGIIKGQPGEKGDPFRYEDFTPEQLEALKGQDGRTPIKGEDYYTPADKTEMVQDVLNAMPSGGSVTAENIATALGYVPVNPENMPTKTSQLTNDSGFMTNEQLPSTLPNPNKLTFKLGGTTYEYDGNSAVSITIEDASEVAY